MRWCRYEVGGSDDFDSDCEDRAIEESVRSERCDSI